MVLNIRHTGIVVSDLVKESQFYLTLGFKEVSRAIEEGEFISQVTGIEEVKIEWIKMTAPDKNLIELIKYHSHPMNSAVKNSPSNKLGCSHIAFTVENINETCNIIAGYGGSIVNNPATSTDGKVKVAYCHDPEGVLLEIVELVNNE